MKKLYALLFLLLLVACDRMSGESYTRCTNISYGLAGDGIGQTVIMIQGYDEDISLWTINTTLTRSEFDQEFLHGMYLSDAEIHELFAMYNQSEIEGITFHIADLNSHSVVIAKVYDYSIISATDLNRIWNVDDFEDTVTLSSAIAGLEYQGAECATGPAEEDE